MNKPIAIIAGEPNSISSEIIFKSWQLRKKYLHKPFFIVGSIQLLSLQKKKFNANETTHKYNMTVINTLYYKNLNITTNNQD